MTGTKKRTAAVLGALCLAVAGAVGSAVPASATTTGIGIEVHPLIDTSIYSGPGLSTPKVGTAWAGDNVAAICLTFDNMGNSMILGIDRPGRNGVQWANTAGYMWGRDFGGDISGLPGCDTYGIQLTPRIDTSMYSAPGLSTPKVGTAWAGDNVGGVCKITDNMGNRMVLGIDRPGRNGVQWANTAGYIWGPDLAGDVEGLEECGLY